MNNTVQNIFKGLLNKDHHSKETFCVNQLPFSEFHKIGVSHSDEPMFFVKCSEKGNSIDINLDLISIMFDRSCKIYEDDNLSENTYTVIKLGSDNWDIQQYFINVMCLVLQQLPGVPSSKSLHKEIDKVIDLFKSLATAPKKTIQGLWAELLIIEQSHNPDLLIRAWHASPEDKFDFNNGKDKVEVKSTAKNQRIHAFSIEQLTPNIGSSLVIASVIVIQTGIGKSVLDLRDMITEQTHGIDTQLKLNELILKTLGFDFEKTVDIYFDYQTAIDSLQYFNSRSITTIDKSLVPVNITNVRFDVDLTNIEPINAEDEFVINSELISQLGL